ncbi:hypothetical protein SVI_2536 [Shewanella violacea DSS12]|uniref:Uncharacterized protein n=1 Tax=Shewanella violacea (strain JCM 10179 / CIP 106290 / LMG 19151 / DSS12) TaxID=637905 RepID=D4ZLF8_SHEVD|nr:hypothetical protein SVI_2536 [Shewanella violacea DSS12]
MKPTKMPNISSVKCLTLEAVFYQGEMVLAQAVSRHLWH